MGKKDEKQIKEKSFEAMTAKELREMALTLEGISGVHAMNKNELIDAIRKAKGIVVEKTRQALVDVRALKLKIQELREKKSQAGESGNNKLEDALRRRISNLKKKTRRAA
ncbi:MAG: Rho termination factor N-terminal domain-containing protein [Syntrophobacteraceae bacterium]|jgi:FtsZ-binding cell division protein ZapB|nr:Rho termination factor N-terminal domain-containing protein [Syntrophobacteraceae bacterium]